MKCPRCKCEFEYDFSKCPECGYELPNTSGAVSSKPRKTNKLLIAATCMIFVVCVCTVTLAVVKNNLISSNSQDDTSNESLHEANSSCISSSSSKKANSSATVSSKAGMINDYLDSGEDVIFLGTTAAQKDWEAAVFTLPDDNGTEVNYIDNQYLSKYIGTGCSVTVELTYDTANYYVFAPKDAVDWNALYVINKSYICGVPTVDDAISGTDALGYTFRSDVYDYITRQSQTFIQEDGFFSLTGLGSRKVKFNLSSDALKYLAENTTKTDEGIDYGGLIFQMYGCKIAKLTISEPFTLDENGFIS